MSFIDYTLEDPIAAYGFRGGPEFRTRVVSLDSGREVRNIQWSRPRHRYTANWLNIPIEGQAKLRAAFMAARGQAFGFKLKDWGDFEAVAEIIGTGNGTQTAFQLTKTYVFGPSSYTRTITRPRAGATVTVNGTPVSATINTATGIATLAAAPAASAVVRWSGQFDVPVRFASDYFPMSLDNRNAFNGDIELIEVL